MSNEGVDNAETGRDDYPAEGAAWTEAIASELASAAGIGELTDAHWRVINALRDNYANGEPDLFLQVPGICAALGMSDDCLTDLFGDPVDAWRVAGLPKSAIGR